VQAGVNAAADVFGKKPEVGRWVFSTNGVSSMGRLGIPTIGFGPGEEKYAHTNEDQIRINDLISAVAFYAAFPAYF
jgi:acetylornithine deacetylase/succinyl-diaminopimelate desuccinylase-like protein